MRVLHVMGSADIGGVASVVYNYIKHINTTKYQFDIALAEKEPGVIGIEMEKMGVRFYSLPLKSKGLKQFSRQLDKLLKQERYDAIHVHGNSTSYVALSVAKKNGIKCRIAHAHTAQYPTSMGTWLRQITGQILNFHYATRIIACGKLSGELVFGKRHMRSSKAIVLPNAVEGDKYSFDEANRIIIREELGLNGKYTIGIIGRLSSEKNHIFAIRIINELRQYIDDFKLVVVGDGELISQVKNACKEYKVEKNVIFTGSRSDMERIYQGLDICIMPSLYEGFPVVGVEAMASGLPLLLSNRITNELSFGKNVTYLPLDVNEWVNILKNKPVNINREDGLAELKENGFDIKDSVHILEKIYDGRI